MYSGKYRCDIGSMRQRLLLVLVPLAGIAYPLFTVVPAVRNWMIEQRLRRLYRELRGAEELIASGAPEGPAALAALEKKVRATRVPTSHSRVLYTLKQHVALVRERLRS